MSKMEGTLHEHDTGYAEWLNSEAPKAGGNVVKYEWFDNNIPIPDGETAYEPVGFGIEPDDTWAADRQSKGPSRPSNPPQPHLMRWRRS